MSPAPVAKKVIKKPAPAAAPQAEEAPAKRGPGRPRNSESNLPDDVSELLALLETTEDQAEKRKIRARLRSRGHRGGLGKRTKKAEAEEAPAKPAAKKKPAARIVEADGDEE